MLDGAPLFFLSDEAAGAGLVARLATRFDTKASPTRKVTRQYLDSFDWLLFDRGGVLFAEEGDGSRLVWEDRQTGRMQLRLRIDAAPSWPTDLPYGPFRERLAEGLGVRRLLRLMEARIERRGLRILNPDRKTTVRVQVETIRMTPSHGAPSEPLVVARLVPVRGFDGEAAEVLAAMTEHLGVPASAPALIEHMLERVGRRPGDTSSKYDLELNADERADVAVKRVLRKLFETVAVNESGVKKDLDSEFLHDYRVAVRRTRSVLSQFNRLYPKGELAGLREELRWLGQLTGPLRDMHVYLIRFGDYLSWLPEAVRPDLAPLQAYLSAHEKKEHRKLANGLKSERYASLMASWRVFLETEPVEPPPDPDAALPILRVASRLTWRAYRRALKQGQAILASAGPAAEAMHRLRITCKKLRYLMELFRSLYPADAIKELIGILKALQDCLGDHQDYTVQQQSLIDFGRAMLSSRTAPVETLMAMGRLEAHLEWLQQEARAKFTEVFGLFAGEATYARFAGLFRRPAEAHP